MNSIVHFIPHDGDKMTLDELLATTKYEELVYSTKRSFRPLSPMIDITNNPMTALTILVNLTEKGISNKNLLNKERCKEKLRAHKWWAAVLKPVQYRHSHNVKFPDIRSTGTIRTVAPDNLPVYFITSSKLPNVGWTYSKDSSDINRCLFFTSEFLWAGQPCCLARALTDSEHPLWSTLKKLGCYEKNKKLAAKLLSQIPGELIDVDLTGNYLSQVSFPDGHDSYLSFSPVASQAMQSCVYQSLEQHYQQTAVMGFDRAANMGLLSASCGGRFRLIETKPYIKDKRHHYISEQPNWLTKEAIQSIEQFLRSEQWLVTHNEKPRMMAMTKSSIRSMVNRWLATRTKADDLSPAALAEHLNSDIASIRTVKKYAYQPKLTRLFIQLIGNGVECVDSAKEENTATNSQHLLLPELRICGGSAISSSVSVGLFSMMSLYGFINAFERNIQRVLTSFTIDSFAICIHDYHLEKRGLTKKPIKKAKVSRDEKEKIAPPAIYDDYQFDSCISLIIKTPESKSIAAENIVALLPKRFARGTIRLPINGIQEIGAFPKPLPAIQAIKNPLGSWLSFEPDFSLTSTDAIVDIATNHNNLWLTVMGYQHLEPPTTKPGSLRDYPHALVENILGFVKPRTVTKSTNLDDLFWRYQIQPFGVCLLPRSIK
ncbi:type I-F CRISPR-associated protein Csy2 [Vibrio parahaemolyticus]|uniref:type I-F CRISPR-associated protein Csy2 n=3 Tax=Vibrio parahaemolyticus TaxID=670 RepID=UPI00193E50C1|nr:type I-F CRISPR-associated protein Csy2 [Vibrio parahaemolyticus]EHH1222659.1 CRISPR-associated protein Csy2 [Vibrio parahaemolyticus]EIY8170108.1 CRISPR-associated protein Csy2 [Vibrio parahaemolyticus]EIY8247922.1 CRISPR-associated protein Csy2 [Vibrio parahaemolyticus]ELA8138304.1 CRISPR-associated protein Csy2 [Vibrio parahaemolyticus]MBM4892067.1 CRISPR-associated protein Csy2 [Vibrio parahaemolyticus]